MKGIEVVDRNCADADAEFRSCRGSVRYCSEFCLVHPICIPFNIGDRLVGVGWVGVVWSGLDLIPIEKSSHMESESKCRLSDCDGAKQE